MVTLQSNPAVRSQPDYSFDFCGGHLAIDFTNTVGNRGDEPSKREDHFGTFADVVAWAESAKLLNRRDAGQLRAYASAHADAAHAELRRALDLREALYGVLAAHTAGRRPHAAELETLNKFVAGVYSRLALSPAHDGLTLNTTPARRLDVVLDPVVRAAVDLLTTAQSRRVGVCSDDTCGWLFLDTTRSGTRRWCDMKVCGNRNKVRRFRTK